MAAGIHETARMLWHNFYMQGLAPRTWGKVMRKAKEKFICEMEKDWLVLHYYCYDPDFSFLFT